MAKKRKRPGPEEPARAPSSEEGIAEELLTRLTRMHRNATRGVVAASLVLALGISWWAVHDSDVAHGGFLFAGTVGLTGGITFGATFLTSFGVALAASRAWMRKKAATVCREAAAQHGLEPDAFAWVVGMFSPKPKGMGFEDDLGRGRRR